MSLEKNPKLKFLLILPIIGGIIFFGTSILEFEDSDGSGKREHILTQFAINYESMMSACGEEGLDAEQLQSCLDAFDEVREFCTIESAVQCGDEQMDELERKLSDN